MRRFFLGAMLATVLATSVAGEPRLNRMIETLDNGSPVFGTFARFRDADGGAYYGGTELDFVLFDMEHGPTDVNQLRTFLLGMIDRGRQLKKGNLQLDVTPIVRVPANGIEKNQWMIKQALDAGRFCVMTPHIANVDEARHAVVSTRYPQASGVADFEPAGERGVAPGYAARYWGLSVPDYMAKADIWPLDRAGELALLVIIEDRDGVNNVREILAKVPGISAIFIGPFDLSTSLGVPAQPNHPLTEQAVQKVLAACKEYDVPCGILANKANVEKRLKEGFRLLVLFGSPGEIEDSLRLGKTAAGR
jgi:4-hydroxy-2-oxoheptanedioate aldolase